jgi:hypothetical protein
MQVELRVRVLSNGEPKGTRLMSRDWIEFAYDLLQQQLRDAENVERLTAHGCPAETIDRMLAFLPLACGRVILGGIGISHPPNYRPIYPDGTVGDPKPLAADPEWRRVMEFVEARRHEDGIRIIGTQSAEFDAVNRAMLAGSDPANLVGSDPVLYWSVGREAAKPVKPWWAFWSK